MWLQLIVGLPFSWEFIIFWLPKFFSFLLITLNPMDSSLLHMVLISHTVLSLHLSSFQLGKTFISWFYNYLSCFLLSVLICAKGQILPALSFLAAHSSLVLFTFVSFLSPLPFLYPSVFFSHLFPFSTHSVSLLCYTLIFSSFHIISLSSLLLSQIPPYPIFMPHVLSSSCCHHCTFFVFAYSPSSSYLYP